MGRWLLAGGEVAVCCGAGISSRMVKVRLGCELENIRRHVPYDGSMHVFNTIYEYSHTKKLLVRTIPINLVLIKPLIN